jgi:ABC-type transporter Mla MlaB component
MLRITVHDEPDKVRLKLEGNLVGPWVAELEEAWRAAQLTLAGRALSLDVTAVGHVDSAGKYLLALLRGRGADVTASGTVMTDLVRTIAEDWPLR